MSPVVTLTVVTLLSESRVMSTCVLSETTLPGTTLSPYSVFFSLSMDVLKPQSLSAFSASFNGRPGWISSFICFAQSSCRLVPHEVSQVTVLRRKKILAALLFMQVAGGMDLSSALSKLTTANNILVHKSSMPGNPPLRMTIAAATGLALRGRAGSPKSGLAILLNSVIKPFGWFGGVGYGEGLDGRFVDGGCAGGAAWCLGTDRNANLDDRREDGG